MIMKTSMRCAFKLQTTNSAVCVTGPATKGEQRLLTYYIKDLFRSINKIIDSWNVSFFHLLQWHPHSEIKIQEVIGIWPLEPFLIHFISASSSKDFERTILGLCPAFYLFNCKDHNGEISISSKLLWKW